MTYTFSNIALKKNFGKRVRELRQVKNLSQEELADMCGLHRTFIGRVERGETNITLINILRITIALNIKLSDFFNGFETEIPSQNKFPIGQDE